MASGGLGNRSTFQIKVAFTADGKPVVYACNEVGDSATKASKKVKTSGKDMESSFSSVGAGASRLKGVVGNLMGAAGIGGLAFGFKDLVSKATEWQKWQALLKGSLQSTGQYSASATRQINEAVDNLSTHGGFDENTQYTAINRLTRSTGSYTAALKWNQAAQELARGSGMNFTRMLTLVQQAANGTGGRLTRYLGPSFQAVHKHVQALTAEQKKNNPEMLKAAQLADKQATAQEALALTQKKYGNALGIYSHTTAGAISNLKNSFDMMIRKVGVELLPVVQKLVTFLAGHIKEVFAFGAAILGIGVAVGVAKGLQEMWKGVKLLSSAFDTMTHLGSAISNFFTTSSFGAVEAGDSMTFATAATMAFKAAFMATIVGAVLVGIVLVITHFKQFKEVVRDVFHAVMGVVSDVFNWIKRNWPLVAGLLLGPVAYAAALIIRHWHDVLDFVKSMPGKIAEIGRTMWDGIKSGFAAVINWIIDRFNDIPFIHGVHIGPVHIPGIPKISHIHMAQGGLIGGYGGGDIVPTMTEPGEYVLRKEAVQHVGVQRLDAINAAGSMAGGPSGGADATINLTIPLTVKMGVRAVAEEVLHYALKQNAMSGSTANF